MISLICPKCKNEITYKNIFQISKCKYCQSRLCFDKQAINRITIPSIIIAFLIGLVSSYDGHYLAKAIFLFILLCAIGFYFLRFMKFIKNPKIQRR